MYRKSFCIYTSQAISALSALTLSLFLIKIAPKEWVGNTLYFIAINTIIINIITSPLGMWLTRLRGSNENKHEIFAVMQLWTQLSFIIFLLSGALVIFGFYYASLAALFIGTGVIASSYTYEWNSDNSYILYSIGISFAPFLRTVIVATSLIAWPTNITAEIAATISSIITMIGLFAMSKLLNANTLPRTLIKLLNFSELKKGGKLAMSMATSSLIYSGYQTFDKTLTKNIWGAEKAAELMTTHQWSYVIITTALQPIIAIIYPSVLQGNFRVLEKLKHKPGNLFYLFIIIIFGCYILQLIAAKLLPQSYLQNAWWLWLGMISGIFFIAGQIVSISFSKEGSELKHIISVLIPSALSIPVMHLLIKEFGVVGALYAGLFFSSIYLVTCITLEMRKK